MEDKPIETALGVLKGAKVLMTGGAGFIGQSLARRLAGIADFVVLDNAPESEVAARFDGVPGIDIVSGDVRELDSFAPVAKDCDYIVHLASIAGVDSVMKRPLETMEVILEGTMNALRAAAGNPGLKRFVNFSTSEVFGDMAFKLTEQAPTTIGAVGQSRWTYSIAKATAEHLAYNYHRMKQVPSVSIRPFNIYGPMQIGIGAIHVFVVRALRGEPLEIHNDGTQIRSWCYIDDMVDATILAMADGRAVGESFNIGNPRSTVTTYNLARQIVEITGSESEIKFIDWQYDDIELRVPNIDKAKEALGFSPGVELHDGLRMTIDWYRRKLEGERG